MTTNILSISGLDAWSQTLYQIIIHGHTHSSDSPTVREDTADKGQLNGRVAHIELATIHDS